MLHGQLSIPVPVVGHLAVALETLNMLRYVKPIALGAGSLYKHVDIHFTSIYMFHLRKPPSSNNFDSNLKNHYTIASSPLWVPAMRMLLLMMVAVCLNAVITLEQPFSSFFEFYPRFRDFIRMLQHTGGPHAVP